MNELQKNWLEPVEELYNSPELKFLIGGLGIMIPFVSVADSVIGASINKLKQKRLKTFFDELNQGDIVLTEEQIKSDDFLNAYFETANYVLRTKSDKKIKRFALILKRVYSNDLTIEDFDDYIKVFDDLTDREFAILNVKYRFEQDNVANPNGLNPFQLSESYWANFKNEVANKLNIPETDINAYLVRLQRTGCFLKHRGYWEESDDELGNTTGLFKTIMEVIKKSDESE